MRYFRLMIGIATMFGFSMVSVAQEPAAGTEVKPDPRLNQKITYSAAGLPLSEVTEALTKLTKVHIEAGIGVRDWKSRERRISVRAKDKTLGETLNQIAKTLHFFLGRFGKEGEWEYRLWQDLKGREFEKAMLLTQQEAAERSIKETRKAIFTDAEKALSMSKADALKLKTTDPWTAFLGGTESGRAYSELMRGLPDVSKELMLRGREVNLSVGELSPEMQGSLKRMVDNDKLTKMQMGMVGAPSLDKFEPERLVLMQMDSIGGRMASVSALGMVGVTLVIGKPIEPAMPDPKSPIAEMFGGMPLAGMPIAGSDSLLGRMIGMMGLTLEEGGDLTQAVQAMGADMEAVFRETLAKRVKPTEKPTDPVLLQEVEPIKQGFDLKDPTKAALDKLAEVTRLGFILDFYPSQQDTMAMGLGFSVKKEPLYKALDAFQMAGYEWEYSDGFVRLRPKDWAVQRSYDIPDAFIEKYRKKLETDGWFDLDTTAEIVFALTEGQLLNRFAQDPELLPAASMLQQGAFGGANDLLWVYGGLTAPQKAQMKTDAGLPFAALSDAQWDKMADVVETAAFGQEVQNGRITLKIIEPKPKAAKKTDAKKPDETKPDGKTQPNIEEAIREATEGFESNFVTATFTIIVPDGADGKDRRIQRAVMLSTKEQVKQVRDMLKRVEGEVKKEEAAKDAEEKKKQTAPSTTTAVKK